MGVVKLDAKDLGLVGRKKTRGEDKMMDIVLDEFALIITSDEAHFHLNGYVTSKIADIGQLVTRENCTSCLRTDKKD
ncbi:unnamed protein product [Nezara viridula]|uniref:Uncharacterized protein n=1 Tax=Nezara viridula TaxID=85310 RepID=A0A9P0HF39_NEZVI|nr:unnamed protein product [Nezara viridula]